MAVLTRSALALTFVVVVVSSCGGEDGAAGTGPRECPTPAPASDVGNVPTQLHIDRHATITDVTMKKGALGVTAVSELSVVELYPPLARAVLDAGYSIVSSDNEGFEAEIFFGDDSVTGAYRLREAPCGDRVIVRLLFEEGKKK